MTTNQATGFICALADLPDGQLREHQSGTLELLLLRRGQAVCAWHNVCPHQGRALNWAPNRFVFDDTGHLVCAHHGAVFELEHGACVAGPCRGASLTPVTVEVRDGDVFTVS